MKIGSLLPVLCRGLCRNQKAVGRFALFPLTFYKSGAILQRHL